MRFRRRDFIKVGAAGMAGVLHADCRRTAPSIGESEAAAEVAPSPTLKVSVRGLCLLEYKPAAHTLIVHMLDGEKVAVGAHDARLSVETSALDKDATSLDPSRVENAGTSQEIFFWDLKGKQVSILEDPTPDLTLDPSQPPASQQKPVLDNWKAMKWIPNLGQLSGASAVTATADKFVCSIPLKKGRIQGEVPKSRIGPLAVWTFKNPADGAVLTRQAYSDTVLYTRQLNGRTPTIKIGSGKVVLRAGAAGQVVLENAAPPPATDPGTAITLGHFDVFYGLVDKQYVPVFTVTPTDLPPCASCETDPIYCPPSWI